MKTAEGNEGSKDEENSSWNALKDDYLLHPKKNWDEESSEDEVLQTEIAEEDIGENLPLDPPRKKQRAGRH